MLIIIYFLSTFPYLKDNDKDIGVIKTVRYIQTAAGELVMRLTVE